MIARRDRDKVAAQARKTGKKRRAAGKGTQTPIEHARCHMAAFHAIAAGTLVREPCLFCDREPSEAHHHDYDRPLDVTWLCHRHHRYVHISASA